MMLILPASETKHIRELEYEFVEAGSSDGKKTRMFLLNQRDDHGLSNGTTLWLGGQVLSYYLASLPLFHQNSPKRINVDGIIRENEEGEMKRKRVIELGSGIGLTALVLSAMGWDVCATDIEPVLSTVLGPNISKNTKATTVAREENSGFGRIECRELDWMVRPEDWNLDHPVAIARQSRNDENSIEALKVAQQMDKEMQLTSTLGPPYDLIVTADTLYIPELVTPLIRSIQYLARLSTVHPGRQSSRALYSCPIYVAVERRDPQLMDKVYEECSTVWGFKVERVRVSKIRKALERAGVAWKRAWSGDVGGSMEEEEEDRDEDGGMGEEESPWGGVEIWKMRLPLVQDEERV